MASGLTPLEELIRRGRLLIEINCEEAGVLVSLFVELGAKLPVEGRWLYYYDEFAILPTFGFMNLRDYEKVPATAY